MNIEKTNNSNIIIVFMLLLQKNVKTLTYNDVSWFLIKLVPMMEESITYFLFW